jgi:single-strand DNA-binding protein
VNDFMNLNKVFVLGNLTRDPELKALPSGMQVASFGLATNSVWKDKEGNQKQATEFHNIVVFGRQGELCAQYLRKGQSALIEGRIQTRSWDGADGAKRYRTEIVADRVQFGQKSANNSGGNGQISDNENGSSSPDEAPSIEYPVDDISAEDIPF